MYLSCSPVCETRRAAIPISFFKTWNTLERAMLLTRHAEQNAQRFLILEHLRGAQVVADLFQVVSQSRSCDGVRVSKQSVT